ncbi:hypothetical protein GF318_01690 [Candidatus Micrarchaeota archaeon]|nr:hypothetical protein [Candidatus Micrarchaeota archaeon]
MKIKLTPELAYLVGLWRKARTSEGVGVQGNEQLLETFSTEAIEKELTTTDKLLTEEDKAYFYHSAYRKFFQCVEKEQLERFKYLNEYAANYLAGLFDAVGHVDEKGIVSLGDMSKQDQVMLLRLGFGSRRRGKRLVIERPLVFLAFIRNYVKVKKGHRVFDYIKQK